MHIAAKNLVHGIYTSLRYTSDMSVITVSLQAVIRQAVQAVHTAYVLDLQAGAIIITLRVIKSYHNYPSLKVVYTLEGHWLDHGSYHFAAMLHAACVV